MTPHNDIIFRRYTEIAEARQPQVRRLRADMLRRVLRRVGALLRGPFAGRDAARGTPRGVAGQVDAGRSR